MGILSILALLTALFVSRSELKSHNVLICDHSKWVFNSALLAVSCHLVLLLFICYEAYSVISETNASIFSAIATHWVLDHILEAIIGIYLTYRTIKGILRLIGDRSPYTKTT